MSLFRRREPLHVRLAREGGMPLGDEQQVRPAWDAAGIHGLQRPRQWDVVTTVDVPELEGERAVFVVLSPQAIMVEEGPDEVEPLAAAIDRELAPPYRAEAVRRQDGLWAVGARRVELVELPGVSGEELELVMHGDEHTLLIDGERAFGSIPALERPDHVTRAHRVVDETWELEVDPL